MENKRFGRGVLRGLTVLLGAFAGAMVGFYVTIAFVVARARAGYYIFAVEELAAVRLETITIFVGLLVGAYLAYRKPYRSTRALIRGLVGLIVGALVGAGLAALVGAGSEWIWSAGVIVSALTMLGVMIHVLATAKLPLLTRADYAAAGGVGFALFAAFVVGLREPDLVEIPELEPTPLPPPSAVDEVVFIVGDAGATLPDRTPLLRALQHDVEQWSGYLRRDSAVSVVFAGDIVYPVGVRDRDHPLFPVDSARLWNQVELVGGPEARRYRTLGHFVPGNHDWGSRSDARGIDRVLNLDAQLGIARNQGLAVRLLPPAGLPGPFVRDVRSNLRFIFLDTHWFLRTRPDEMRREFLQRLDEALQTAGDRHVIIVSHHPFRSAGPHGEIVPGYHNWGLELLVKRTGALVQDLNSPVYDELLQGMRRIFATTPNPPLAFVGGHDHSLQVIEREEESDPAFMLVSGAGSKLSGIRTLPSMHYGASRPGYMMLLLREDDAVDLFVVAGEPDLMTCRPDDPLLLAACMTSGELSFDYVYGRTIAVAPSRPVLTDTMLVASTIDTADTSGEPADPASTETSANVTAETPVEPAIWSRDYAWWTRQRIPPTSPIAEEEEDQPVPPSAVPARMLYFRPDSVVTTAGASYLAGFIHSLLFGELNRNLWDVPVRLPVLDLDTLGGGIVEIEKLTGGRQTVGVRMVGRNGVTYQFRNIVKEASRAIDSEIGEMAVGDILEDQLAAQFPFAAMVVAELLQAVDVLVAAPRAVVMPNDHRLGDYRPYFAGRVGWIEVRPNERDDDGPGFAGSRLVVGGPDIFEELRRDANGSIDARKYLRTRMIDFLVGDWDRHPDNMRWARFEEDGRARWEQIPRDRDWAFTRTDGFVSGISSMIMPRYVGFSDTYPPMERLAASGYQVDHLALGPLSREDFMAEARQVRRTLTDSVLTAALGVLPPQYLKVEQARLMRELRVRRDSLVEAAEAFYEVLSRTVHVYTYEDVIDHVRIEPQAGERVRVTAWVAGREEEPYFDRLLDPTLTRRLRLYVQPEDEITRPDSLPIEVVRTSLTQMDESPRDY